MDLMRPYSYSHYSNSPSEKQYPSQSKDLDTRYFSSMNFFPNKQQFHFEEQKAETEKNPEMYDVNTYDSFISTTSDLGDFSSLSESERISYGNFNFFSLKRSQFNSDANNKNTLILNPDGRKNTKGKLVFIIFYH